MKRYVALFAALSLLLVFSVGVFAQNESTIAGVVEASTRLEEAEFTILLQALEATDLLETLDDVEASFTVFAPTDAAFEELLEELDVELEEFLEDTEALSAILLYHVVEGELTAEDFEDDSEIETLNGASIAVTVTNSDEVVLDEFATVMVANLAVGNGIIHVIDGVLLPPDGVSSGGVTIVGGNSNSNSGSGSSGNSDSGEACIIFTDAEGTVQIRVGPGENRTSIAFLAANVEFEVLGQAVDDAGNVWFKLDKDQATPNRSNAEAWVSADAVESTGNCDDVVDVNAPPVIPITQAQPTAAPSSSGGSTDNNTQGDTGTTDTSGQIVVQTGTWTESISANFDASCQGTGNVSIPTTQIYSRLTYSYSLSRSGTGFILGGTSFTYIGDNTYQATETVGSYTGTWYLRATAANRMEGRFIFSFRSGNSNCSATIYSTFTR